MKYTVCLVIFIIADTSSAEVLWKLGAGIGNITANSYPGSDQTQSITSPIPYLKVKTKWFDLDREGLHTNWFENTNFRLDFSFDLGLPVKSSESTLRAGMRDLDPVAQFGPLLIYQIDDDQRQKWQIHLPLTYAYSFDDVDASPAGRVSNPRIYFNYLYATKTQPLDISLSLGPVYGSAKYHDFYYSVEPAFSSPSRPEYLARQGHAGYRFNVSVTRLMNGYWLGVYLRYQNLTDAVFVDSPLVKQKDYWFIAVGASWLFAGNL
ncbi:MAG: MipA/OmpV family protein [Gammaproteobacteria bacterium]|nr:MipA/OmpV family protein [Gammaproteobacteria bacterium]